MPAATRTRIPIDYASYFSLESKYRERSRLKEIKPFSEIPGMINFGVGIPHPSTFPVDGMTLSLPFVGKSVFVPGYGTRTPEELQELAPYTPTSKTEALNPDLAEELQYSATYGQKHFLSWIKEHVRRVHAPLYDDWEVCCTAGNTDGVDGVMRALLDRGDHLLVEEFAYPGLLSPAVSLGLKSVGVPMDDKGIVADELDRIMDDWDENARGGPRPKLLVLVPTCSNPAGVTIPVERKREIYDVCRKHNILICEDDPYCFLQIRPNGAASPIVPTFLSLDIDGRVIRVDSFSKIVAPGARLGFVTGPAPLVEKIMNTRESATQCPSGFSVAAVSAVLRAWGSHDGFENRYIPYISDIYSKRCLMMIDLLKQHVDPGTIEIPQPSGGMFLFVRLKIETHPDFPTLSPSIIAKRVFDTMVEEKVLAVPGLYFRAPSLDALTPEEEARKTFFRISFSLPPPDVMKQGVERIGRALARDWRL